MEEVPCGKLHAESPFHVESHAALHVETRVPTHRTLAREVPGLLLTAATLPSVCGKDLRKWSKS